MSAFTATTPARDSAPASTSLFLEGVRAITPMAVSVIPFGLAIGAAAAASNTPTLPALASAPLILAGAAQLSTIQLLDAGVAPLVVIASALMINARILLYSASLAPWFRGESLGRRLLLALPVIDQLHFTVQPRFERGDLDRSGRITFYVGAATCLLIAWITSNSLAVLVGAQLPESAGLHVAAPVALAGLLARSIDGRRATTVAITAAIFSVVAVGLPFHSVVLVASLAGIAAGTALSAVERRRTDVGEERS